MQVYTKESGKSEFRHFLDNQQYQTNGILRYERIFGQGYVSTGGFETTKVCSSTELAVCCGSCSCMLYNEQCTLSQLWFPPCLQGTCFACSVLCCMLCLSCKHGVHGK